MTYSEVVEKAKSTDRIGYGKIEFQPCRTWQNGDQINLWTYWQGYQLTDIDKRGVDILLVGQDWGNPCRDPNVVKRIEQIQAGNENITYVANASPTDITMAEMFKVFGNNVDITKKDPGMRLFFTNYSLGYRAGSETGGMTKKVMKQDSVLFDELVLAIKPKIIICLGKLTYEMVSGTVVKNFIQQLSSGIPFKSKFSSDPKILVYGVAHCGAWGLNNVGGKENMIKAWRVIASDYSKL